MADVAKYKNSNKTTETKFRSLKAVDDKRNSMKDDMSVWTCLTMIHLSTAPFGHSFRKDFHVLHSNEVEVQRQQAILVYENYVNEITHYFTKVYE